MTANEFKEAIRPLVRQYMHSQREKRLAQGNPHIFRIDSNTKSQVTRVVSEIFADMSQRQQIEGEVYR